MELLKQTTVIYLMVVGALATGVILGLVIMYARGAISVTRVQREERDDRDWWRS